MQITIKGCKGFTPTEAIMNYATEKLERMSRKSSNVSEVKMTLVSEKEITHVIAVAKTWSISIKKTTTDKDMYKAIDLCVDSITRLARKEREKKTKTRQHKAKAQSIKRLEVYEKVLEQEESELVGEAA